MVELTGATDVQTSPDVVIDPDSNNPTSVVQTSTLGVQNNGGVGRDGFELSADVTGSDRMFSVAVAAVVSIFSVLLSAFGDVSSCCFGCESSSSGTIGRMPLALR